MGNIKDTRSVGGWWESRKHGIRNLIEWMTVCDNRERKGQRQQFSCSWRCCNISKTNERRWLYYFTLFLLNVFPADTLLLRASGRKVVAGDSDWFLRWGYPWIVLCLPALLVHQWATECGGFALCTVREEQVSWPAQLSPVSLTFALSSCGLCFSHVSSLNAYAPWVWKTSSDQHILQGSLSFQLSTVILKCSCWKQQLCALALLVEELWDIIHIRAERQD